MNKLEHSPLGKKNSYISTYTSSLLFSLPRIEKRQEIGVPEALPFFGEDIWNGYEVSWLNLKGKPEIAIVQFRIPCESEYIIESKSFKLYLNSLNQSKFSSVAEVQKRLQSDLSHAVGVDVKVVMNPKGEFAIQEFWGTCIDYLDIKVDRYTVCPEYLSSSGKVVEETLYSNLLKSNCLVTGQPDWGSVQFRYVGPKVDREGLLKYIISFREHNEFHEQCIERMFMDILTFCKPEKLTVYGRYTRRGGLDINPFRSNFEKSANHVRTCRQ